jgi:hypothetical protein
MMAITRAQMMATAARQTTFVSRVRFSGRLPKMQSGSRRIIIAAATHGFSQSTGALANSALETLRRGEEKMMLFYDAFCESGWRQ